MGHTFFSIMATTSLLHLTGHEILRRILVALVAWDATTTPFLWGFIQVQKHLEEPETPGLLLASPSAQEQLRVKAWPSQTSDWSVCSGGNVSRRYMVAPAGRRQEV